MQHLVLSKVRHLDSFHNRSETFYSGWYKVKTFPFEKFRKLIFRCCASGTPPQVNYITNGASCLCAPFRCHLENSSTFFYFYYFPIETVHQVSVILYLHEWVRWIWGSWWLHLLRTGSAYLSVTLLRMTNLAGITKTCCTLQFVFVIDIEQPIEDLPLHTESIIWVCDYYYEFYMLYCVMWC